MKFENSLHSAIFSVGMCAAALCLQEAPGHAESSQSKAPNHALGDSEAIRPFRVSIPNQALVDLRRRIMATRLPEQELVADTSQGVQLATMQELARYWGAAYDWRKCAGASARRN